MKKIMKIASMAIVGLFALVPMINVEAKEVSTKEDLLNEIAAASTGETITLTQSIKLDNKNDIIAVGSKEITIEGINDEITITGFRDDGITEDDQLSGNQSIITALEGGIIHLKNLKLIDSQKYGVQAYDGGYVSLNNVRIDNCRYGAILLNGGTVEVVNLSLGENGENGNNGIEVSKSINLAASDNQPSLIMNGTLNSDVKDNVIRFADDKNDGTTGFIVKNMENTTDKILVNGTTAVITDNENNIKYESNELKQGAQIEGDTYVEDVEVTDPTDTPTTPTEEVKNEVENPETSDGALIFISLTVIGFAGTALAYRRLHN